MAHRVNKVRNRQHEEVLRAALDKGRLRLGDACRALRALEGYSQVDLAALVGVNVKVIKAIESANGGNPGYESLAKIAGAFGLEVSFVKPDVKVELMDPAARAADEGRQRLADGAALASGKVSARELHQKNALRIDKVRYKLPVFA